MWQDSINSCNSNVFENKDKPVDICMELNSRGWKCRGWFAEVEKAAHRE